MVIKNIDNFNLAQICQSGQCFRMSAEDEATYSVIAGDRYLEIQQQGTEIRFSCSGSEFESFWKEYFDLDNDYSAVTAIYLLL